MKKPINIFFTDLYYDNKSRKIGTYEELIKVPNHGIPRSRYKGSLFSLKALHRHVRNMNLPDYTRLDIFSKQVNHVKWIIKNNKLVRIA